MEISEKLGKSLVDKSVFLVLWKNWKNSASRLQTPVTMESIGNSQFKGKYGFWNVEFKLFLFSLQDLFASPFSCEVKELNQHCLLAIRVPVLTWTQRLKQELKNFGASCLHLALAGPATFKKAHCCTKLPCYLGIEMWTATQRPNEQWQRLSSWAI